MKAKLKVRVMAAKRFKMDNMSMSQLYVEGDLVQDEDKMGCPTMKMNGDYDVFESLRGVLPCECEVLVEFRQGSGDKMTQYVLGAVPLSNPDVKK